MCCCFSGCYKPTDTSSHIHTSRILSHAGRLIIRRWAPVRHNRPAAADEIPRCALLSHTHSLSAREEKDETYLGEAFPGHGDGKHCVRSFIYSFVLEELEGLRKPAGCLVFQNKSPFPSITQS